MSRIVSSPNLLVDNQQKIFEAKANALFADSLSDLTAPQLTICGKQLALNLFEQMGGNHVGFSLKHALNCVFKGSNQARLKVIQKRQITALVLAKAAMQVDKSPFEPISEQSRQSRSCFSGFKGCWGRRENSAIKNQEFSINSFERKIQSALSSFYEKESDTNLKNLFGGRFALHKLQKNAG